MVGDVKQSIYRFRQAMPELFMEKKKRFSPYDSVHFPAKISLSMKKALPPPPKPQQQTTRSAGRPGDYEWQSKPEPTSFEDMMSKFKQTSDEKMSALKKGLQAKRGGGYSRHGSGSQR